MLQLDATRLLDYMLKLWPKWDRNEETDRLWLKWLTGPLDYNRAREAADRYRMATRYNSPQIQGMKDALRSVSGEAPVGSDGGYGGFFIQCFDGRQQGRCVPVVFGSSRREPHPSAVQAVAEEMRARHEGTYGGRWRTVEDPDGEVYFAGAKYLRQQQKGQNDG